MPNKTLADHLEDMKIHQIASGEVQILNEIAEAARKLLAEYDKACEVVGCTTGEGNGLRQLLLDLDHKRTA